MSLTPPLDRRIGAAPTAMLYVAGAVVSVGFFFRHLLTSHLGLISGDIGDSRIVMALLEHWLNVFTGQAPWESPFFFHPVHAALGYTDAYFLYSLPYALARLAGIDVYLSYDLSLAVVRVLGFLGMAMLLRSGFRLGHVASFIGAVLFTIHNSAFITINHAQLLSVSFVPMIVLLYWQALRWHDRRPAAALAASACASVILGLLLLTAFYIGWFFVLASATGGVVLLAQALRRSGWRATRREILACARRHAVGLAVTALAFVLGAVPFALLYLPKLRETGGHSFGVLVGNAGMLFDIVNIGEGNLLWGATLGHWLSTLPRAVPMTGEVVTGFTPGLFLAFLAATVLAATPDRAAPPVLGKLRQDQAALLFGVIALGLWLMSVRVGHHSLWWLIYALFPGGSAMRIPGRLPVFLAVLVIPAAMVGLDRLFRLRGIGRLGQIALALIAAALVVEQVNISGVAQIDRRAEMRLHDRIPPPPAECRAFFVTGLAPRAPTWEALDELYAPQVDAMLIAERWRLPTINGVSTWFPPGWGFYKPRDPHYLDAVRAWIAQNHLALGMCRLDLSAATWSPDP